MANSSKKKRKFTQVEQVEQDQEQTQTQAKKLLPGVEEVFGLDADADADAESSSETIILVSEEKTEYEVSKRIARQCLNLKMGSDMEAATRSINQNVKADKKETQKFRIPASDKILTRIIAWLTYHNKKEPEVVPSPEQVPASATKLSCIISDPFDLDFVCGDKDINSITSEEISELVSVINVANYLCILPLVHMISAHLGLLLRRPTEVTRTKFRVTRDPTEQEEIDALKRYRSLILG